MKFTLGEIYSLTRNMAKLTSKELPIKVSYRLYKFIVDCSNEMEALEKARVKLVEKYAEEKEEDKEVKEVKVSDKNQKEFQKEFSSLLEEEVDIDFEPISIEELGNINISANDLIPLKKIIKEK